MYRIIAIIRKIKKGAKLLEHTRYHGLLWHSCRCIKRGRFSTRAWRGHDCVLRGLKTLFLANFQRVERLKQEKDI